MQESQILSRTVAQGVPFLAEQMPGYHTATLMLRIDGGLISEPADKLGLAYVLEQTLDKGSEEFSARQIADAYDVIGARMGVYTGRQSWVLVVSALPEHLPRGIELLSELLYRPSFPTEIVETTVSLTEQELFSLQDSPRALLRRQMAQQAYGPLLGRHPLGSEETLAAITPQAVRAHWQAVCGQSAISVAAAGAFDLGAVEAALEQVLSPLPPRVAAQPSPNAAFTARRGHVQKDLEQTQIGISYPGVAYDDPEQPVEKVMLGVLSGGMSSRLFTEVREKLGLVYWVGAWAEQPHGQGMLHIGAATKPERAEQTYETLLKEVARLEDDLTEQELDRAKVGLIADATTSGASVQQRANELLVDHFHLGRAVPAAEKRDELRAVGLEQIASYLRAHPRQDLSIVTVGPEPLLEGPARPAPLAEPASAKEGSPA